MKLFRTITTAACLSSGLLMASAALCDELNHETCYIHLLTGPSVGVSSYEDIFYKFLQDRGYIPVQKNDAKFLEDANAGDLVFSFDRTLKMRKGIKPNKASVKIGLRKVVAKHATGARFDVDYAELRLTSSTQWFYGDHVDTTATIREAIHGLPRCLPSH